MESQIRNVECQVLKRVEKSSNLKDLTELLENSQPNFGKKNLDTYEKMKG